MADSARRLAGPVALTTTAADQYTATGVTAVLRNIHVCNESGTDRTFSLSIGPDGAGKRLFSGQEVLANDSFDWSGFQVLAATEKIQALASANTALTLTVSGVEVS